MNNCNGRMEGKEIFVSYGGKTAATGSDNAVTLTGNIAFNGELDSLRVTFGVKDTHEAAAYRDEGAQDGLNSTVWKRTRKK